MIVCYGGEEFAIILPDTDSAALAAERFGAAIEAEDWRERQITVSLGVATLSPAAGDATALLAAADAALYQSKKRGRNCVTHAAHSEGAVPGGAGAEGA